jgi:hypothetical protein
MVQELVIPTNFLLAAKRKSLGKTQSDLRLAILDQTGIAVSISRISDFETSENPEIANGVTRAHYEAVIARWDREAQS